METFGLKGKDWVGLGVQSEGKREETKWEFQIQRDTLVPRFSQDRANGYSLSTTVSNSRFRRSKGKFRLTWVDLDLKNFTRVISFSNA